MSAPRDVRRAMIETASTLAPGSLTAGNFVRWWIPGFTARTRGWTTATRPSARRARKSGSPPRCSGRTQSGALVAHLSLPRPTTGRCCLTSVAAAQRRRDAWPVQRHCGQLVGRAEMAAFDARACQLSRSWLAVRGPAYGDLRDASRERLLLCFDGGARILALQLVDRSYLLVALRWYSGSSDWRRGERGGFGGGCCVGRVQPVVVGGAPSRAVEEPGDRRGLGAGGPED